MADENKETAEKGIVRYTLPSGEELTLSPGIVRQYLVNGSGKVSDQEVMMFTALCKFQKLNPFLREAYLIKYGDNCNATIVVGKETFLKRAARNPRYNGHEVGIIEKGEKLTGAYCRVHLKGIDHPIYVEVDFEEYVGLKDGRPNKMWASKPKTMIKKVAELQGLRTAFPEDLGGMYGAEEINTITHELPVAPVGGMAGLRETILPTVPLVKTETLPVEMSALSLDTDAETFIHSDALVKDFQVLAKKYNLLFDGDELLRHSPAQVEDYLSAITNGDMDHAPFLLKAKKDK